MQRDFVFLVFVILFYPWIMTLVQNLWSPSDEGFNHAQKSTQNMGALLYSPEKVCQFACHEQ